MRTKKGVITSAKMTGTVTVTVHRAVKHPLYQKRYRMSKKFLADTNGHDLWAGDEVTITEILKKAARVSELAEESALEELLTKKKEAHLRSSGASDGQAKEVSPAKS